MDDFRKKSLSCSAIHLWDTAPKRVPFAPLSTGYEGMSHNALVGHPICLAYKLPNIQRSLLGVIFTGFQLWPGFVVGGKGR
jgi:hypothetical protein